MMKSLRSAGSGDDKHGGGGDIKSVRAIAAGADNIYEMLMWRRNLNLGGQFTHHRRGGGNLADGFFLDPQAGKNRGGHHWGNLARHDLPHQRQHFIVENLAVFDTDVYKRQAPIRRAS